MDKTGNILSLTGFSLSSIAATQPHSESYFGNMMIDTEDGGKKLKGAWERILNTVEKSQLQVSLDTKVLTALATCFSFGLDEKSLSANEEYLLSNFVAT